MSYEKLGLYDIDSEKHKFLRRHSTDLHSLIIIKMRPIQRLRRGEIDEFKVVKILVAFAKKHGYSISLGTHENSGLEGISVVISNINHHEFRSAMRMIKAIMQSFMNWTIRKFIIIGWKNRFKNAPTKIIFKD